MNKAYLSLGSNIGDSKKNILEAYRIIEENDIKIIKKSSFYETEPVGFLDQDNFINSVIEVEILKKPYELLEVCHLVEEELKRKRVIRWGPRTIDVDILLFNDDILNDEKLIIPHKEMTKRGFVLVPLKEINNNIFVNNISIDDLLLKLDISDIKKITNI